MHGVGMHCTISIGRQLDDHQCRVRGSDLGADRSGHGHGHESSAGGQRTTAGEHGSPRSTDTPCDDEHHPSGALLRVGIGRAGPCSGCCEHRPGAFGSTDETWSEPPDRDTSSMRRPGRQEQAAFECTQRHRRVGGHCTLGDAPVVSGHAGGHIARDDGSAPGPRRMHSSGSLDDAAAQRPVAACAEQTIHDHVGVRDPIIGDEMGRDVTGTHPTAARHPAGTRSCGSVGCRGIDAIRGDDAHCCTACGQQRGSRPPVPTVVPAPDDDVDP